MKLLIAGLVSGLFLINPNQGLAFSHPDEIENEDMMKIPDVRPTTYYIANEAKVSCKGKYGRKTYNGKEKQTLLTPNGKYIATVCGRFGALLLMEGSGILKSRGAGEIAVNYGRKVKGQARYTILDRCKYGEGVRGNLCLLPYHTIATDNKVHKVDEILYIPAAKGIQLPDGSTHDGTFIVRDTGGAFKGTGGKRVDLFVGTAPDFDNVFQRAGFDKTKTLQAFKVKGQSAERIKEKLQEKFGELY